ncbi:MAG: aminotransferase class III-fold pyridoxal phosphate-dependent enzyme [Chromatiaceae bacterium]|nr:aminotransferase class III-fold pyridoxal phosphate-dependent enzyme [Chromatiaceae bacterium]
MNSLLWQYALAAVTVAILAPRARARLRLSRAKSRSLQGHPRISRLVARLLPYYAYEEAKVFCSDGAPEGIAGRRRAGFERLAEQFRDKCPLSLAFGDRIQDGISDMQFTDRYRVPFQYRDYVREHLKIGSVATATSGTRIRDLDGNWAYDLSGSYGVNLFGYDFYRDCIDAAVARIRELGPVLGPYHPVVAENIERIREVSGLDEVSFHMSGTEAVMQAVRLARYHTRKSQLVIFCGSYHGWWDGVQPGIGNRRRARDVYVLKDMSELTLDVLRTRKDIACVLVNPLQALHPNSGAPGDATLIAGDRRAHYDRHAYTSWLRRLRDVCTERSIVLIFDEVFVGFRLAYGGAQEYFGVRADMVTYGKSLGGGLPVGVVCGKHHLMKRFRENRPSDVSFARGTFNSHPYVMGAMNEFLRRLDEPKIRAGYQGLDALWNGRVAELNRRLESRDLPVRARNLASIWTIVYEDASRYNWMFQYYLRAEGLALSWVGSGRLIFSHDFSDEDVEAVMKRFIDAATAMKADEWWWSGRSSSNKAIKRKLLGEIFRAAMR